MASYRDIEQVSGEISLSFHLRDEIEEERVPLSDESQYSTGAVDGSNESIDQPTAPHPSAEEDEEDAEMVSVDYLPSGSRWIDMSNVWTKIQVSGFVLIFIVLICTLADPSTRSKTLLLLGLWRWELLLLALVSGRLISGLLVRVLVLLMERSFYMKTRILFFVYKLRFQINNSLWLTLVFILWRFVIMRVAFFEVYFFTVITRIFVFILIASWTWAVKTFIVKFFASSFYFNTFLPKIEQYFFARYMLRTLSSATPVAGDLSKSYALSQNNISAWKMKRAMQIIRRGVDSLTSCDETMHVKAKATAEQLFANLTRHDPTEFIQLQHLKRFMVEDDALRSIKFLMGANAHQGNVISECVVNFWVSNTFQGWKNLVSNLEDIKEVITQLNQGINVIFVILNSVLFLVVLKIISFMGVLAFVLLFSFAIRSFIDPVIESLILICIRHPYDVGDYCEVDGQEIQVEKIELFQTVFLAAEGRKVIISNCDLFKKIIKNYSRDPSLVETINLAIHSSMSAEKISLVKERIKRLIEREDQLWNSAPHIVVKDIPDTDTITISVCPSHRHHIYDVRERQTRRESLLQQIQDLMLELNLSHSHPSS